MARYIDADELIKKIFPYDVVDKKRYAINAEVVYKAIQNVTTADVVEVVRCKGCRFWEETVIDPITNHHFGFCRHYQWQDVEGYEKETNDNDFCSYGERKEK